MTALPELFTPACPAAHARVLLRICRRHPGVPARAGDARRPAAGRGAAQPVRAWRHRRRRRALHALASCSEPAAWPPSGPPIHCTQRSTPSMHEPPQTIPWQSLALRNAALLLLVVAPGAAPHVYRFGRHASAGAGCSGAHWGRASLPGASLQCHGAGQACRDGRAGNGVQGAAWWREDRRCGHLCSASIGGGGKRRRGSQGGGA